MAILKFEQSAAENATGFEAHPFEPVYRTVFIATGEDNLNNVSAFAHANIAATVALAGFGTLFRQPLQFSRKGFKVYEVEAMYGKRNWTVLDWNVRGSTAGGGTFKMTTALDTISTSAGAPDFGDLIGVNQKDGTVEGVEEELPALDFSIDVTYPVGFLNSAMLFMWSQLAKRVNSVAWLGFPAGSVYYRGTDFEGVTITSNTAPLSISHQISVSPNLVNVTIAGFANITKDGWDVLSWLTEDQEVGGVTVQKPIHWYVQRTKLRAAFASYLGFG